MVAFAQDSVSSTHNDGTEELERNGKHTANEGIETSSVNAQAAAQREWLSASMQDSPPSSSQSILKDSKRRGVTLASRLVKLWTFLVASSRFQPWEEVNHELAPLSLQVLPVNHFIRKPLIRLIRWKPFEWLMLLVIAANCVTLAMQSSRPGFSETTLARNLLYCDYFFIAAFALEMVVKIIALGFVTQEHTYLRSGWNVLDLTVVIFGFLQLSPSVGNNTAFRAIRVLRPLRLITKIEALRLIVTAVINSLPMLKDVAILWLFFFTIFGILCLQLFTGKLYYRCGQPSYVNSTVNGTDYTYVSYSVNTSSSISTNQVCRGPIATSQTFLTANGPPDYSSFNPIGGKQWGYACPAYPSDNPNDINYPDGLYCIQYNNQPPPGPSNGNPDWGQRSFDNILFTWILVFQHVIPQDWSFIMYNTQAAVSWWTWILHVSMAIIGSYLISNLIIAILFIHFTRNYSKAVSRDGSTNNLLGVPSFVLTTLASNKREGNTPVQASPTYLQRVISIQLSNKIATAWRNFRTICFVLQAHSLSDGLTTIMIVLNSIVLGIIWFPDEPTVAERVTNYANYAFTFYFLLEMTIKLIGLGPKRYSSDNYNNFDGFVTVIGVIDVSLDLAPGNYNQTILSVFRTLRLLRIFRLARKWKSLRRVIRVLFLSLVSVAWLTVLLALFLFICGLLGMSFFGYNLDQCPVSGSSQLCPPGLTWRDCPAHFDCYMPCTASQAYQWFTVPGSPYGGQAYCEVFPRRDPNSISPPPPSPPPLGTNTSDSPPPLPPPSPPSPPFAVTDYTYNLEQAILNTSSQYWAQVGKATTFQPNYDDIYQAIVSIFVMLTADNYDTNMKLTMVLTNQWVACLFTISVMILGIYIVLNLFLAILLANLDQIIDGAFDSDVTSTLQLNTVMPLPHESLRSDDQQEEEEEDLKNLPLERIAVMTASFWVTSDVKHRIFGDSAKYDEDWGLGEDRFSPSHSQRGSAPLSQGSHIIDRLSDHVSNQFNTIRTHHLKRVSGVGSSMLAAPPPPPATFPMVRSSAVIDSSESTSLANPLIPPTDADPAPEDDAVKMSDKSFLAMAAQQRRAKSITNMAESSGHNEEAGDASLSGTPSGVNATPLVSKSHLSKSAMKGRVATTVQEAKQARRAMQLASNMQLLLHGKSLFVFGKSNPFRVLMAKIMVAEWFQYSILIVIVLSSLALCFDDVGVEPGSKKEYALFVMDVFFTTVFGIEVFIKVVAQGFAFNGRGSYIRSGWNVLDLLIFLTGVLVLTLQALVNTNNIIWLRAVRALRALRPMRLAAKIEGIRIVVAAIKMAIPVVGEILMVALLFYYIFAVLGVHLMGGLNFYCLSSNSPTFAFLDPYYLVSSGNINKTWCEANGGSQNISTSYYHSSIGVQVPEWQLAGNNWGANGNVDRFDNVVMALFVLFQVATLENWSPIMFTSMTLTDYNLQPLSNASPAFAMYFLFFVLFCVFFILNMVIGVSINMFNVYKRVTGKSALLTDKQQEWLILQRMMTATKPNVKYAEPTNKIRSWVFRRVMTEQFDRFMLGIIILNVLTMFMQHNGQGWEWTAALNALNAIFIGTFILEMFAKWLAMGIDKYFQNGWCQFDFVVVVFGIAGVFIDYTNLDQSLTFLSILRVMRVLRIVKVIPKARGLKMMMITLVWCAPALLNVGSVLFLVMFIYAIVGMNIFGFVKLQQNLTSDANFQTFPSAMLFLFRITTGENWNNVMTDCMIQEDCILVTGPTPIVFNASIIGAGTGNYTVWPGTYLDSVANADVLSQIPSYRQQNSCSPSPAITAIFFESYMLIVTYLLLQLVIGIIIENIEEYSAIEQMPVTQNHMRAFVDTWEELDAEGSGFVDAEKMTALLMAVPPPMGVKGMERISLRVQEIVQSVRIPLRNLQFHFLEALHALTGRVAGTELPADAEYAVHNRLIHRLPKDLVTPKYSVADYYAALHVKTSIQGFLFRDKLKALVKVAKGKERAVDSDASRAFVSMLSRKPPSRVNRLAANQDGDDFTRQETDRKRELPKLETFPEEVGSGSYDVDAVRAEPILKNEPFNPAPPGHERPSRGSRSIMVEAPSFKERSSRSIRAPPTDEQHIASMVEPGHPSSPSSPSQPSWPRVAEVSLPGTVQSSSGNEAQEPLSPKNSP